MPIELNATHDPQRRSFVESANAVVADFPIQNLPFGVFDDGKGPRGGVALGDMVIDLAALLEGGLLEGAAASAAMLAARPSLMDLFEAPRSDVSALRAALSDLYKEGSASAGAAEAALIPAASVTMKMPAKPAAFTDFCTSADHILRMAKNGGRAPQPAWATLPVAYNGRASSVAVSGTPVVRPMGQVVPFGGNAMSFAPEPMLDFELEFGAWLRGPGNALGQTIDMRQADELIFGCCLVNDWSARAIQFYEMILGPHLGKSFLTTISPWIVTLEALAPFRVPGRGRTSEEPEVPAYLNDAFDRELGGFNIELTTELDIGNGPQRIVRTNVAELFWTLAQMIAHQASGGAPLETGDLIATGTVSGAADEARACLVEITSLGKEPLDMGNGETRTSLQDGDTLSLHGRAIAEGYVSIGFGECTGTIAPGKEPGMSGEVFTCSDQRPIPVSARGKHLVVDIHCHLGIPAGDAIVQVKYPGPPPGINDFTSPKTSEVNRAQFAQIGRTLNTIDTRLADMDRLGIDVQALSPSPGQYFYFADPETGRAAARAVNDGMADAVAAHPDRFVGMGTVPLQDVGMAVEEMRRCVKDLDLRGIEISSNVQGRDLHGEEFRPFWAAAEELGVLIFIHPLGFTHAQRMSEYYFNNLIGNPLESTLAVGHLIFGGVLDAYPGLRICVAHGGGYMPAYWGRMDHGWRARGDCSEHCQHEPSSYLRKMWFDTLVFDKDELDSLIRTHGADRLCLGTDYPFDMSEPDPIGFHDRLDEGARARILGLNAAELLGLQPAK